MTPVFAPVRQARAVWARTYAEQLPLYVDDLTQPRLLSTGRPPSSRATPPAHQEAAGAEQPNTNAVDSHDSGRVSREPTAEGV